MIINYPAFYNDIINGSHTLIAGTTGSGKSVALNGLLYALSARDPARYNWILIDPKKVELVEFKHFPAVAAYAAEYREIEQTITAARALMLKRYNIMQRQNIKKWTGPQTYIIIDEFIDIKQYCSKDTIKNINALASLARAAGIHLVICTQRPTKDSLSPLLKDNLPIKLALTTESIQQSKYLTNTAAAYGLPIGSGLFYTPARPGHWQRVKIDLISPEKWKAMKDIRQPEKPPEKSIFSRWKSIFT